MPNIRSTTRRDRFRKIVARDQPPCHICGEEIDYDAHYLDPLSFTIDHVNPLAHSGRDGDILENVRAAHRACNRAKGTQRPNAHPGVTFVTERSW